MSQIRPEELKGRGTHVVGENVFLQVHQPYPFALPHTIPRMGGHPEECPRQRPGVEVVEGCDTNIA